MTSGFISHKREFFGRLPEKTQFRIVEFLLSDLGNIIVVSKVWRRTILDLLEKNTAFICPKFLEKYAKIGIDPQLRVKHVPLSGSFRVDVLVSFRLQQWAEGKRVIVSYKCKNENGVFLKKFAFTV